jgi:hypothetical protein
MRRRWWMPAGTGARNRFGGPRRTLHGCRRNRDAGSDHLDNAARAFLAPALVDVGRERAAGLTPLVAPAPHLPGYQRSSANARLLLDAQRRHCLAGLFRAGLCMASPAAE